MKSVLLTDTIIHRFNIDTYHSMISAGILHEDDRVELIEGRIVDMTPIGIKHSACVKRLNSLFNRKLQGSAIVSVQDPVQLSEDQSEPQPDISLLKYKDNFYSDELPAAEDVLLIIEVADTSVKYDREVKIPLYARTNIREVWLVNLPDSSIEIYTAPISGAYEFIRIIRDEQTLSPNDFPEIILTAKQILGL